MASLAVENVSFTYPGCDTPSVQDVSFSLERGDFAVLCGDTGSGKSTLLRLMKRELIPVGTMSGQVCLDGTPLSQMDARTSASKVGFVMQRPEQQLVTDKVWHELAFGLENMGLPRETMRRRVAEMACYFGIEDWFLKNVADLSGGQKQLLNLAAVMVMQPEILLLDESTAQLDPIAASEFLATLQKLNRDFSVTILLAEHRLEEVIPISNKVLALENGRVLAFGETRQTVTALRGHARMVEAMPAAVRLHSRFSTDTTSPLTVREGRTFIESTFLSEVRALPTLPQPPASRPALSFTDVFFRYEKTLPDVLHGLSFTAYENEIFCILGGNGSGKSTALAAAAGLRPIYSGEIRVFGQKLKSYKNQSLYRNCLSLFAQDVQTMFLYNTVREELAETGTDISAFPYDFTPLLYKHPYDLSGGQQQLLALAKVLGTKPRLLLLDEPTKGLDANAKTAVVEVLKRLRAQGITVVIVTHDVEFAAECADRCALFFRGEITSVGTPSAFFSGNSFYTTAVNRMTRGYYDGIVTLSEAEQICRRNGFMEDKP